jgi:hypothetical protein
MLYLKLIKFMCITFPRHFLIRFILFVIQVDVYFVQTQRHVDWAKILQFHFLIIT